MKTAWVVLAAIALSFAALAAVPAELPHFPGEEACTATVQRYETAAANAKLKGSIIAIALAVVGAVGSGLAAFVSRGVLRKVSGVCGAVAAVLTAVVAQVGHPDEAVDLEKRARGHLDKARKATVQLATLESPPPGFKKELERYILLRYEECQSPNAHEEVPDYPRIHAVGTLPAQALTDLPAAEDVDKIVTLAAQDASLIDKARKEKWPFYQFDLELRTRFPGRIPEGGPLDEALKHVSKEYSNHLTEEVLGLSTAGSP